MKKEKLFTPSGEILHPLFTLVMRGERTPPRGVRKAKNVINFLSVFTN